MRLISIVLFCAFVSACGTTGLYIDQDSRDWKNNPTPDNEETIYTVYLIGDAGSPNLDDDPTLQLFTKFLNNADEHSAPFFLVITSTISVFLTPPIHVGIFMSNE